MRCRSSTGWTARVFPYRCRQVESLFFTGRVVRDITDIIRFAQNPYDGELFLSLYYKLGARHQ